jgi:hypothetical protein
MLTVYRQVSERDKALAIQRAGLGRRWGSPVVPLRNSDSFAVILNPKSRMTPVTYRL